MRIVVPIIAAILALSACASAPPPWTHSSKSKEAWAKDYASCRRRADREVAPAYEPVPDQRGLGPFREAERDAARKRMDELVAGCMRAEGYVPARGK
ncbi:MAG: hypothetical protein HQL40_06505 [Alphaproteobacteria bacterium]|nr:hypothetical protein [Alphaproteobacteria bacterium]